MAEDYWKFRFEELERKFQTFLTNFIKLMTNHLEEFNKKTKSLSKVMNLAKVELAKINNK